MPRGTVSINKLCVVAEYATKKEAKKDAKIIQAGDDEWTYKVKSLKNGKFAIAVYDEKGDFVDYWQTLPAMKAC